MIVYVGASKIQVMPFSFWLGRILLHFKCRSLWGEFRCVYDNAAIGDSEPIITTIQACFSFASEEELQNIAAL